MSAGTDVLIIGGGAAGCMAAIAAAEQGARVQLLERNAKIGRKLYITGKGRCNVTNDCTPEQVLRNVPGNGKFLYSVMDQFPPARTMEFFESIGVPLKTERGSRVFPCSDKASDIIDALLRQLRRHRVCLTEDRAVRLLLGDGRVLGAETERGERCGARCVILATGGLSYPGTGSTGDGYRMAEQAGHTVTPTAASLVPLETEGDLCQRMQGLSLRNVTLKVLNSKRKAVFQEQGELLFTHFGLSGPLVLSASAHLREFEKESYTVVIDLKPALDEQKLDARLLRELEENSNRDMSNVLSALVPRLMIPVMEQLSGIPGSTKANEVRREQRRRLLTALKGLEIPIRGKRPIAEAIVTSGGVKVKEIDPKTMESKLVKGLYFAGELLDVDAYTGGFNLQIAWATGYAAGRSAAHSALSGGEEG